MSLLENLYSRFRSMNIFSQDLLNLLALLVILIILNEVIKFLYSYLKDKQKIVRGYYSYISKDYIMDNFTDKSFEKWCSSLCSSMGLSKIKCVHDFEPGASNIIGSYKGNPVHISTILTETPFLDIEDNERAVNSSDYLIISKDIVRSFAGNLICNNVKNGIILTTGYFSDDCKKYIESLSSVSIELIDGDLLLAKYLDHIHRKSTTNKNSNHNLPKKNLDV